MIARKSLLSTVVAFLLALAFAACGGAPAAGPAGQPASASPQPFEKPTEAPPARVDSVAILVIDDFDRAPPKSEVTQGNCIVDEGGQYFKSGGSTGGPTEIPHGALVYKELQELIKAEDKRSDKPVAPAAPGAAAGILGIETWNVHDRLIRLVAIDTDDYTTSQITQRIRAAITELGGEAYKTRHLVLNMSFAMLPCDPLRGTNLTDLLNNYKEQLRKDPKNPDLIELESELERLVADSSLVSEPQFAKARLAISYEEVRAPVSAGQASGSQPWTKGVMLGQAVDPLFSLIVDPPGGSAIISVAAAGNAGYPFPFAPGLWSNVLAVSAPSQPAKGFKSNAGEVLTNGQHTSAKDDKGDFLPGTSFAAPRLSLQAALYLLAGRPSTCVAPTGATTTPPMAYAPELLNSWVNMSIRDAAAQYCADFPTPTS